VASLSVSVTGAPAPTIVALTGSAGTTGLTTSTPNVTAATVAVGQSTTVNVSYANPNAVAVKVGAVIMSQPAIMATSVDNCSNATLAAGASCTTTVTVSPKTAGAYSGTASLGLSGGGTPAVATISGTANPAPPPPAGGGGGGGCSVMPEGADPDSTLPLAMLIVVAYWLRQRAIRRRDKA
jgi:MYXO-CTERM domain-containing protein